VLGLINSLAAGSKVSKSMDADSATAVQLTQAAGRLFEVAREIGDRDAADGAPPLAQELQAIAELIESSAERLKAEENGGASQNARVARKPATAEIVPLTPSNPQPQFAGSVFRRGNELEVD